MLQVVSIDRTESDHTKEYRSYQDPGKQTSLSRFPYLHLKLASCFFLQMARVPPAVSDRSLRAGFIGEHGLLSQHVDIKYF